MSKDQEPIGSLLASRRDEVLGAWVTAQLAASSLRIDLRSESELRTESKQLLDALIDALTADPSGSIEGTDWLTVRQHLEELSRQRALDGYSPSETATFVFSFKQPVFDLLREQSSGDQLGDRIWQMSTIIDSLGLLTVEAHQRTREEVIRRQQEELLELSTPVVKLWDGAVAVPLIGTLDSARTQVVMESLLERIVETDAQIAIVDITGVPTVDTLVAQHLLRTVAAARLMGADCIISGIRPQIAQTIVHLGLDLSDVITKATLADAFEVALAKMGHEVVARREHQD
ncbi:MAG TPA: STAS domain-containing protein [Solirubrobacteraceae bacterium]|nr:STAS domain-containing protein [Solirubrobacteraceae bacterium]